MKKLITPLITLLLILVFNIACQKNQKKEDKSIVNQEDTTNINQEIAKTEEIEIVENDSLALLELTKRVYKWEENIRSQDFAVFQNKTTDTIYAGIDLGQHKLRLADMRDSRLFSEKFIKNYDKIGLKIDEAFKKGTLVWNVGQLPPFGNGASPWCNCQDKPDNYLQIISLIRLSIKDNVASYDWGFGNSSSYHIKAIKENKKWKIMYMEGFDYQTFINSFQKNNDFKGRWQNGMVTLNVGDSSIAIEYHGQCVYFYPIRKISDTEFEMIWAREMDCKFDNGTDKTFDLTQVPTIGRPFAKFKLINNVLKTEFYYQEWVNTYSQQVQEDVFSSKYERKL